MPDCPCELIFFRPSPPPPRRSPLKLVKSTISTLADPRHWPKVDPIYFYSQCFANSIPSATVDKHCYFIDFLARPTTVIMIVPVAAAATAVQVTMSLGHIIHDKNIAILLTVFSVIFEWLWITDRPLQNLNHLVPLKANGHPFIKQTATIMLKITTTIDIRMDNPNLALILQIFNNLHQPVNRLLAILLLVTIDQVLVPEQEAVQTVQIANLTYGHRHYPRVLTGSTISQPSILQPLR